MAKTRKRAARGGAGRGADTGQTSLNMLLSRAGAEDESASGPAGDTGEIMAHEGVAIRVGQHCCHPLMQAFEIPGTARASLYFYNTREDIDRLAAGIGRVKEVFGGVG